MKEGAASHPSGLSRHFAGVAGREVHYLCAGSGPVAVLLPAFPWSAGSLAPLAMALADDFTVVVMDLPGYGNSHPLGNPRPPDGDHRRRPRSGERGAGERTGFPTLDDYADAVAENLSALGIDRCHLYGTQTGAQVALEVAIRHPQRIAHVVLDGLPLLADSQRQDLADNFCPRFAPSWDGAHIAAIWRWCREQSLFAPWYRPSAETRIDIDEPSPGVLQRRAADVLRAGEGYGDGLRAAFAHPAGRSLDRITVPHTLVAAVDDPFTRDGIPVAAPPTHRKTIDLPPSPARETELGSLLAGSGGADRSLRSPEPAPVTGEPVPVTTAATGSSLRSPKPAPATGVVSRRYVTALHGQLLVRYIRDGGRPLVMLHTSPASSALLEPLMREMAAGRPVIAFDNPANGDSDPPAGRGPFVIADLAAIVHDALADLVPGEFDLYGSHTGALIAIELAISNPRVHRLILEGVTLFDDGERPDLLPRAELLAKYLPAFEPSWDGTHLTAAWHFRRAFTTYWPWFRRSRDGIRWVPMVELAAFHRGFVEVAKRLETYHLPYRAALAYPTAERLPLLGMPTLIAAHPDDPLQAHSPEAADLVPGGRWDALPGDLAGVAALYGGFLRDR